MDEFKKSKQKVRKKLRAIARLEKKNKTIKLELNQLDLLNKKPELLRKLAEIESEEKSFLVKSSFEFREANGFCGNCCASGHKTANCPRPFMKTKKKNDKGGWKNKANRISKSGAKALVKSERKVAKIRERLAKVGLKAVEKNQLDIIKCPNCGSIGHALKNCPRPLKASTKSILQQQAKAKDIMLKAEYQYKNNPKPIKPPRQLCVASIMCVTEKPSIAKYLSKAIGGSSCRSRAGFGISSCQIHTFHAYFPPAKGMCHVTVTSCLGHLKTMDFSRKEFPGNDPGNLFGTDVEKVVESSVNEAVQSNLVQVGKVVHKNEDKGSKYLYLWLDCDSEGENIAFEVIDSLRDVNLFLEDSNIFRAHFSSLTTVDLKRAWNHPKKPNLRMSQSVDARQEMDLKIGCSFTRFFTMHLRPGALLTFEGFAKKNQPISFGPCQTPTLKFCYDRALKVENFKPQKIWELLMEIKVNGEVVKVPWAFSKDGKTCNRKQVQAVQKALGGKSCHGIEVVCTKKKRIKISPPSGLNTVGLLMGCARLGISSSAAMASAEKLYTSGLLSYPRTESTKYARSFDFESILKQFEQSQKWKPLCAYIRDCYTNGKIAPRCFQGNDKGDHPPITPCGLLHREGGREGKTSKVFTYVSQHFFASLLPALECTEVKVYLKPKHVKSKEKKMQFLLKYHLIIKEGWTKAMPWRLKELGIRSYPCMVNPDLNFGGNLVVTSAMTQPPPYLQEHELIQSMETNGIGTDASIPNHIKTIIERGYVTEELCQANSKPRCLKPTPLGTALVRAFLSNEPDLVLPKLRSEMEKQCSAISKGKEDKTSVVNRFNSLYLIKFRKFTAKLPEFRSLFISEEAAEKLVSDNKANDTESVAMLASDLERARLNRDRILTSNEKNMLSIFFDYGVSSNQTGSGFTEIPPSQSVRKKVNELLLKN